LSCWSYRDNVFGVTTKFTISLPDDLAEYVRSTGNASAYVAEAVRRQKAIDATRKALEAVGVREVPTDEYEKIAADVAAIEMRRADPNRRAHLDAKLAEYSRRRRP
jgi:hypothetical protein